MNGGFIYMDTRFKTDMGKINWRQGLHGAHKRLVLTTDDLAKLFKVKPGTIRQWLSGTSPKLVLTNDPVKDLLTIINLLIDRGILSANNT